MDYRVRPSYSQELVAREFPVAPGMKAYTVMRLAAEVMAEAFEDRTSVSALADNATTWLQSQGQPELPFPGSRRTGLRQS